MLGRILQVSANAKAEKGLNAQHLARFDQLIVRCWRLAIPAPSAKVRLDIFNRRFRPLFIYFVHVHACPIDAFQLATERYFRVDWRVKYLSHFVTRSLAPLEQCAPCRLALWHWVCLNPILTGVLEEIVARVDRIR